MRRAAEGFPRGIFRFSSSGVFGSFARPMRDTSAMWSWIRACRNARATWVAPQGDVVSEPVFVPRSADAAEGDGWVTAVAYRDAEDVSELLVFEAQDLEAGPIGSALMPRRVPFGFHGNWVSA